MGNMVYAANKNLVPALRNSLAISENKVIRFLGIATVFLIAFILTKRPEEDLLALGGFLVVLGALLYFVPFVRRIFRLKHVVRQIEVKDGMIVLDTVDLMMFGGRLRRCGRPVTTEVSGILGQPVKNNMIVLPYATEIFSISRNGRQYYLVAAFFDDFEKIKSSLL